MIELSKKQPIKIKIGKEISVIPEGIFESDVVPSGNGAVIKFFKKYIGQKVLVIVIDKMK